MTCVISVEVTEKFTRESIKENLKSQFPIFQLKRTGKGKLFYLLTKGKTKTRALRSTDITEVSPGSKRERKKKKLCRLSSFGQTNQLTQVQEVFDG